jgi:hypothetical protein
MCSPATMTCERPGDDSGADARIDSMRIDGCTPTREICGDGIDQDCDDMDPPCAANDGPGGAIDITAGGTFMGDALLARDDVAANGCGGDGGRDLFFKVTLGAPEVYYLDTFGSSFDSVVRVYAKPCSAVGSGAGAAACIDDACGGAQSQVAVALPAGESCIVVDQRVDADTTGDLTLNVVRGVRDGLPLASGVSTNTGDTCSKTNASDPLNQNCDSPGNGGKDQAYFFTTCPGETLHLDADTCNGMTNFDSVLYVKRINGNQLGCNDDDCGNRARITNVPISNSALYFLFVDGFDPGSCGPYELTTNLKP